MTAQDPGAAPPAERGRRGWSALLVALALLAGAVLATIAAIQIRTGRHSTALGDTHEIAARLRDTVWAHWPVLVVGIAVALLGLAILLAGLITPPRKGIDLLTEDTGDSGASGDSGDEQIDHPGEPALTATITAAGLRRQLSATSELVAGIDGARVRVGRSMIDVRARSPLRDDTGLAEDLRTALSAQLDALRLARPRELRVRVLRKKD